MSKQIIGKIVQVSKIHLQPPLLEFSSLVGQTNWWKDEYRRIIHYRKATILKNCIVDALFSIFFLYIIACTQYTYSICKLYFKYIQNFLARLYRRWKATFKNLIMDSSNSVRLKHGSGWLQLKLAYSNVSCCRLGWLRQGLTEGCGSIDLLIHSSDLANK